MKRLKCVLLAALLIFTIRASAKNYEMNAHGVNVHSDGMVVELQCFSNSIIRVLKYPEGKKPSKHSYSVIMSPQNVKFKVEEKGEYVKVTTDSVSALLNVHDGSVTMCNLKGECLLKEKSEATQFVPVEYGKYSTYHVRQAFRLDRDEKISGLGQQQNGLFNQRNQLLQLRQNNTKIAIPYWYSLKGYGIYWDNTSPTTFTDSTTETAFESQCGECSDYYFIYTGDASGVLRNLRRLTGGVQMNALWTYGYFQSKERYQSQKEIVDVVKKYRELQVPLDCIVQDWQYWGVDEKKWNAVEFNNPNFEDASKMISDIHDLNAHIIISVWPSFGYNTAIHKEMKQKGMLLNFKTYPGSAQVYDVFNGEARNMLWKRMHDNLLSKGIDGWWLDATEPEFSDKDDCLNQSTHDGLYRSVYNAFPINAVSGVYEGERRDVNTRRVFILTRSAFAGQQRYATCTWSGDIHATWQVLRNQIVAGLNQSVCGIPYWNTDIGGFITWESYRQGVNDPAYQQLYVRWLQFGTFCPLMRSHGTNTPREIYQFGKPGSWQFETIAKYIRLRYKLLPYIYSTAWGVTADGDTFMKPLFMNYAHDAEACNVGEQYMFGNSIMVAPVVEPMQTPANEVNMNSTQVRKVYLPEGNLWYDFWNNEQYTGGKWIERVVNISEMPLFVKAGSIIPFGKDVQHTVNYDWSELSINVYGGSDGAFTLYSDAGDGYEYENGENCRITMRWNDQQRTLTIGKSEGFYKAMPKKRRLNVTVFNGKKKTEKKVWYVGKEMKLKF